MEESPALTSVSYRKGKPRVIISAVTYNNAHCLPVFLKSLDAQTGIEWQARFFDNASDDQTVEVLAAWSRGEIQQSATNTGYGCGHNRNLSSADGEYLIILNADVEMSPDALSKLVQYLDENPHVAIVGPRVLEGNRRDAFPPRRNYPGEGMIPLEKHSNRGIAWVNGCCFAIRRSVFESLKGFDEDYFLYQAETDLCLRATRAGHAIGYCDDATVVHSQRQSQRDVGDYEYARRVFEGSAIFWRKYYSEQDFLSIVRFQLWLSSFLLGSGRWMRSLTRLGRLLDDDRLRARRDVCAELVAASGMAAHHGFSRIIVRQCQLVGEWLWSGRFPLDDY